MTAPLYGTVTNGVLVCDLPGRYAATLRALEGKRVELIVRERKSTRSAAQLAWHWAVAIPLMAQTLGYDRNEHEKLHYALVEKFGGTEFDARMGTAIPKITASRQMNTKVFSEFVAWEVGWAAEYLGIVIPLPDERDWEQRLKVSA